MLNNIAIRFNKKDFEYDVYSLVKAFYPQAQITMFYEGEEEAEGEYGMFLLVAYGSQEICLAVERDGTEIFRQQVAVEYEKDRPETKNVLKRLVYGALCQVTGRTLPWGDLIGCDRSVSAVGNAHGNPADQDSDETSGRRLEKYRDCPVYEGNIWGKQ